MIMLLVALAIAGVTAYIWCIRGFFSALVHLVCVFAAGAIAFGVWEPVSYALIGFAPERGFGSQLIDMAWGLGLAIPFGGALAILRGIVDKLLPANAQCEPAFDYVGGVVCGLMSGVISAGIVVLSINLIRAEPEFMGYQPVVYTSGGGRGSIERTPSTFIPWVDRLTANLYSHLSLTTMRTMEPMARWQPDFDTLPGAMRLTYEGRSRMATRPDSFRVESWYVVGDPQHPRKFTQLLVEQGSEKAQEVSDLKGRFIGPKSQPPEADDEPDLTQGYLAGFTVKFNSKAKEKTGQVVIGNGQVRLVVVREDDEDRAMALHPIAVVTSVDDPTRKAFARFRVDHDNFYTSSVGGSADSVMAFEFTVPANHRPLALYVKGVRVPVTDDTDLVRSGRGISDKPIATFDEPDRRDEAIHAGAMASMTDVGPVLDESGKPVASTVDTTYHLPPVVVSNSMGFTLQKGIENGLVVVQEGKGWAVTDGEQTIRAAGVKGFGVIDQKLKIDKFALTDDTSMVKVVVSPKDRDAAFVKLYEAAERNATPVLLDTNGTRYAAVGWVYKDSVNYRIRFTRGNPIQQLSELPAVSRSSTDRELTLLFVVSAGVQINDFKIGDTSMDPELVKKPIKADAPGRR